MTRVFKWLLAVLLLLGLLLAAGLFVLQRWLGNEDFRNRVMREAGEALGVSVVIGRIDMTVWPWPALVLDQIQLKTRSELTVDRLEVRPVWTELLQGRVAPATLIVRRAVLPHSAIDALVAALQKLRRSGPQSPERETNALARFLPHRAELDDVTWVDAKGAGITVQANAHLGPDALPQTLQLEVLKGRLQGTCLSLQRDGLAWDVALQLAGGSVKGRIELQPAAQVGGEFGLKGQLQSRDVELSALTTPQAAERAQAAQPLSGRLEASTSLSVRTRTPSSLLDALQTQSKFTVKKAVLHGIDLMKAVKSVGMSRGGETAFDTMTGQMATHGKVIEFSNLAASSGVLSATGQVSVSANRNLSGRVSVELGGAVGMPLVVGGTVSDPEVSLTLGAKIGAALGTILMPGLGTGAGASIGGKIDEGLNKPSGK